MFHVNSWGLQHAQLRQGNIGEPLVQLQAQPIAELIGLARHNYSGVPTIWMGYLRS